MQRRGLVCRVPNPEDRRSVLVELTESGLEYFEGVAHTHLHIMERLTAGLTLKERDCLAGILRKLLFDIEST